MMRHQCTVYHYSNFHEIDILHYHYKPSLHLAGTQDTFLIKSSILPTRRLD